MPAANEQLEPPEPEQSGQPAGCAPPPPPPAAVVDEPSQSHQPILVSSSSQQYVQQQEDTSSVDSNGGRQGLPDSTTSSDDAQLQFAVALTARLDKLGGGGGPRGSPDGGAGDYYENPSSMETQGDMIGQGSGPPSNESADHIDMDQTAGGRSPGPLVPDSTFPLIQYGPMPDPSITTIDDDTMTGGLFSDIEEIRPEGGDVQSESAEPGVCGLRNLGNTCFMASGLQCILATPTIVSFFLRLPNTDELDKSLVAKTNIGFELSKKFALLTQQVYSGQFSVIHPSAFKSCLAESHRQFRGYRQHDCQEFCALLLDTLHEQLVQLRPYSKGPLSECTSMELHTPHSTEVSCDGKDSIFNFNESCKVLHKEDCVDSGSDIDGGSVGQDLEMTAAGIENSGTCDGTESRGSASPKSYTSHSSLEERIPASIRMAPIPECIKTTANGSRGSLASLDSHTTESEDLDIVDDDSVGPVVTSNLVPHDQLKKKQVVFSDTNLTIAAAPDQTAETRNNAVSPLNVGIEDFLKEHKTLNVNMSEASVGAMNNKINFDSEKFARHTDNTRPATTIENLNTPESVIEKNVNVKRVKGANMGPDESGLKGDSEEGGSFGKRIRLESAEKNVMMETERREAVAVDFEPNNSEGSVPPSCCDEAARDPARLKEAIEGDKHWESYIACNSTVIATTMQGQFKNTVICSVCNHVSVSFEPFMYLSLPLPRALDRQFEVTVVTEGQMPTVYLFTVNKLDTVKELKELVCQSVELPAESLQLAEVQRHRIYRRLEDSIWLRYVNDTNRKLYALQPVCVSPDNPEEPAVKSGAAGQDAEMPEAVKDEEVSSSGMMSSLSSSRSDLDSSRTSTTVSSSTSTGTLTETGGTLTDAAAAAGWKSCNICLEDFADSDLITHIHCSNSSLCKDCVQGAMNHQKTEGEKQKCPVCLAECDDSEWVRLDQSAGVRPPLRILTLSVLCRADVGQEAKAQLFGHPKSARVPNIVRVSSLCRLAESSAPVKEAEWRLVLVSEEGDACSRCDHGSRCRGCDLERLAQQDELVLKPGDNLCVHYNFLEKNTIEEINRPRHDASMSGERVRPALSLYDCLEAFSQREQLDQNNPWFCPVCRQHQPAVKTLSVWRYPDFLIVHLKRFQYLESKRPGGCAQSIKLDKEVKFPLAGLNVTPYLSGPLQNGGEMYDLYGVVCHCGSVAAGHYTSYSLHPLSDTWHYFNDDVVEKKLPEGGNQDDAYILFYRRSDCHYSRYLPELTDRLKSCGPKEDQEEEKMSDSCETAGDQS